MLWITILLFFIILVSWIADNTHIPFAKQFLLISMIVIMGLRYDVGRDYHNYEIIYNEPYSYYALSVEPVWQLFNHLLRSIGFQARIFFFVTAIIITLLYYKGIQKMTNHFYMAMILFVIFGFYYESANIVRQFVAMSILFYGYRDFLDGKIAKFILLGLIAAVFHTSALIVLPIILFSAIRIPAFLLMLSTIISFAFGSQLLNIIVNFVLPSMGDLLPYHYSVEDFDSGVNSGILRIAYLILSLSIIWLISSRNAQKDSRISALLNMVVFGIILYNTFYLFLPARRLYLYFFPFIVVLLPNCTKYFTKTSSYILLCIIAIVFGLFLVKANIGIPYNFDFQFFAV